MKSALILPVLASATLMACTTADMAAMESRPQASATLRAADGAMRGTALVEQTAAGLHVSVAATGLPPGVHAAHVHMTGTCTPPDFTSAGGHWNPTGRQHGSENPQGMHMGDMPNMTVSPNGVGTLDYVIAGGTLRDGATALLDADGAAGVIHAGADDLKSDPAGNAGGRIACGALSMMP